MEKHELKNKIVDMITSSIYEVLVENNDLEGREALNIDCKTHLFGKTGVLDSNGLVTVIVGLEEKIFNDFGYSVVIADERALSQEKSPFRTVDSLSEYILKLVEEQSL
jgi:acyl carrier protein